MTPPAMNLQSFSLFLVDQLLKGLAVLALAGLASLALRRASAAKRSAVWSSAFLVLLLLPTTRFVAPQWAWNPTGRAAMSIPASAADASPPVVISSAPAFGAPALKASEPRRLLERIEWETWMVALWGAGAGFLILRRMIGSVQLQRLLRRSESARSSALLATWREILAPGCVGNRVRLRVSPSCLVPVTWGAWRPVVLLPAEAESWSASRLSIVLGHELAHIRRGDSAARTLAHFACALHWCNPLAWFAVRRLHLAQEEACDDLVLGSGIDPADYAAELVESVRRFQLLPSAFRQALAMAQPSTLETRVGAIVDPRRDRGGIGAWLLFASGAIITLILISSALAQVASDAPALPDALPKSASPDVAPQIRIEVQIVRVAKGNGPR